MADSSDDSNNIVDPRGHQSPDVKSFQSLVGALVPALIIGTIYLLIWCLVTRHRFRDVYDCKRRRLDILHEESHRSSTGRQPSTRAEVGKTAADEKSYMSSRLNNITTTDATSASPSIASTTAPVSLLPPQVFPPNLPMYHNPVRWLSMFWHISEHTLIGSIGADAFLFLRFLRLGYWVSLAASILGLLILLPVNTVGGNHLGQLERLSLSNVADGSSLLWIPFVMTYFLVAFVLYLLHIEYTMYVELRQRYLRCSTAQNYSILLRDIPKATSSHMLKTYLTNLLGDDVAAIHCLNHHRRIRHERLVKRKDEAVVRLVRAKRELESSGTQKRPTHRDNCRLLGAPLRWLPAWGPKIDTIDALKNEIGQCNRLLILIRDEDEIPTSVESPVHACIVTVELVRVATAFKTIPFQPHIEYFTVKEAPAPEQVLWRHLASPRWARSLRSILVWIVIGVAILSYTIPVAFASTLSNLTALSSMSAFHWLRPLVNASPALTALIQGFLPPLLVAFLLSLVPACMKSLTRMQHLPSDVECENSAIHKIFLFGLLDIFLAYTIAGSILGKIQQFLDLADHPSEILSLFATTLPAQSTFFMTYIAFGALNVLPAELLRLGSLVVTTIKRKWLQTSRGLWDELEHLTYPVGLHELYNFPMIIFLALVTYSVVAPLVSLFALVYFALAYPVYLHQIVYVYQPTAHTGGTQWPVVCDCCIAALVVQTLLLMGIFAMKKAVLPAAFLLPLLVAIITVGLRFRKEYTKVTTVATLENLMHTDLAEYGPTTWNNLKDSYDPYPDSGRTMELSKGKMTFLTEPYGVVTQGVFSEGQRGTVCLMNASSLDEFREAMRGIRGTGPQSACPSATDYGSLAVGQESGGGPGSDVRQEAYYQGQVNEPTREIQIQVGQTDGTIRDQNCERVDV
ncbi:early-responsive to dehydration 4 [Nannochloropsis oceanica]